MATCFFLRGLILEKHKTGFPSLKGPRGHFFLSFSSFFPSPSFFIFLQKKNGSCHHVVSGGGSVLSVGSPCGNPAADVQGKQVGETRHGGGEGEAHGVLTNRQAWHQRVGLAAGMAIPLSHKTEELALGLNFSFFFFFFFPFTPPGPALHEVCAAGEDAGAGDVS